MAEALEVLAEVAKTAWKYKDELIGGARDLWDMVKPSADNVRAATPAKKVDKKWVVPKAHAGKAGGHLSGNQRAGLYDKRHTTTGFAESFQEINPSMWHASPITDQVNGKGTRVVGRQPFNACYPSNIGEYDPAVKGIFSQEDPMPLGALTYQCISPSILGYRLGAQAALFEKYVFRHIRLVYQPYVAADQAGGFGVSWVDDAGQFAWVAPQNIVFNELTQIIPTTTSTFREPAAVEMNYGGSQTWFTQVTTGEEDVSAFVRQWCQGAFLGAPMISTDDSIVKFMGVFYVEFVCDFFAPYTPLDTMSESLVPITADEMRASSLAVAEVRSARDSVVNKLQVAVGLPPISVKPKVRNLNRPGPVKAETPVTTECVVLPPAPVTASKVIATRK